MLQDAPMYAYIPARDLARARQFYEGKLGFKPQQEINGGVAYGFGGGTACFDSEGNIMALVQTL